MKNVKKAPSGEKFFCWVRVVDFTKLVTPTPPPPPLRTSVRAPDGELTAEDYKYIVPLSWGTPPPVSVPAAAPLHLTGNLRSKGAVQRQIAGEWSTVEGIHGRDGAATTFDFGPSFSDATEAKKWIAEKPEGQRWDSEALNRFLLCFTYFP
jgi:hypothetical protein